MSYFDLNLDLSPEDEAIKDAARRFALEVLRPASIVIDKLPAADVVAPESPLWTCLAQAYELGYHKAAMPEEVGGLGFTPLQSHILMEEIFYGSAGLGAALLLAAWPYVKLLHTGNPDLIKEFVIPFCNCTDASITGAWAITEPDHGSDTLNVGADFWTDPKVKLQLTATADGDEWVLSGQKSAWVSCGPTATQAMVNVQIDTSKGPSGGGVCMLPLDLAGIKRGSPLEKHGVRDLPQGEIFFDEVRIPRDWMFVEPAGYGDWVLGNLGFGNTAVAVLAVAIARAALDETPDRTPPRAGPCTPNVRPGRGDPRDEPRGVGSQCARLSALVGICLCGQDVLHRGRQGRGRRRRATTRCQRRDQRILHRKAVARRPHYDHRRRRELDPQPHGRADPERDLSAKCG